MLNRVPVIGGAYLLKAHEGPSRNLSPEAIAAQAQKKPVAPGAEQVLRLMMDEIARGRPDYSRITPQLADEMRRGDSNIIQKWVVRQGPLMSLTYLGQIGRQDFYRADYQKGTMSWAIALGKGGVIQDLGVTLAGPPIPQNWFDEYAAYPLDERSIRMAEQLGILLEAALIGRLVLRLRL